MNGRDALLRAHVYAAWDARGTERYDAAVARVLDGWFLWPAIEAQRALDHARQERDQRQVDVDRYREDALELLRATSHLCQATTETEVAE